MEDLRQTLRDAGCDECQEAQIAGLWESGRTRDASRVLRLHRRDLMEQLHTADGAETKRQPPRDRRERTVTI